MIDKKYEGSICELRTEDNMFIIANVGRIEDDYLTIVRRRNGFDLSKVSPGSNVVLHIGTTKEKFIALKGIVGFKGVDEINIIRLEAITNCDNRSYARVDVRLGAEISFMGSTARKPIRINDISLCGLSIETDFAMGGVGARFVVFLELYKGNKPVKVNYDCVVQRILRKTDSDLKGYGCSFIFKESDNTDLLWKFIQDQMMLRVK